MGQIIAFNVGRRNGKNLEAERWKALVKGNIEYYNCDDCGGEIEVINNDFPKRCPHCGTEILDWSDEE